MSGIDWGALIVGIYIGVALRPWIERFNTWGRGIESGPDINSKEPS